MELFELIRRRHFTEGQSVRRIARELHVHRRQVRQALADALPPARKQTERVSPVLTPAIQGVIDGWLSEDRSAPRKQRHTAHRVFERLVAEHKFTGAESTVRRYVREKKRQLGAVPVFIVQRHEPGDEAEIDWHEAAVDFSWGRETAQIITVRACFSGREFRMAFPRATQQAFFESHVRAFEHFGGVFARVRYDNLGSAVRKVLRGRTRLETDRFVALRSHYLFASEFCLPGLEGAHEKGGVEGGGGRFRRNHLVPVPRVADYDELNRFLLDTCERDDARRITGRQRTIREDWDLERARLRPLPAAFDTAEVATVRVDAKSLATVRTNRYSVPVRLAGRSVEARVRALHVEIVHDGHVVARHARLRGRFEIAIQLDHYLDLLQYKPGAFAGSEALSQERDSGRWPALYDELWRVLRARYGTTDGTRQLIQVLLLHREHAATDLTAVVSHALRFGGCDAEAIRLLLRGVGSLDSAPRLDVGGLARYDRPVASVIVYDQLLDTTTSTVVPS